MNARPLLIPIALSLLLAACGQQTTAPQASQPQTGQGAPVLGTSNPEAIPGQYVVVFNDDVQSDFTAQSDFIGALGLDPQGVQVQQVYSAALNGFAAKLSTQNLAKLQADKRVKYIEQDAMMHATATQTGATWGLDRVDQRSRPTDGSYIYNYTGSGIKAYIIDTGINTAHTNFGGRAIWGTNTTGDGRNSDCQGHGTHVAGTVGSATWGVAKSVTLVAVKVLNCSGSGTNSGVIAGVNWAVTNKGSATAVANMSLGGGFSQAVNDAVNTAASKNLVMVVAAGNENQNACNVSPASAASAITVGSTTNTDARSSFSNYGSCVDLFAPGSNITSTWIGSTTATNTISGTSMASPHVAGAAVLRIAAGSSTNSAVTSAVISRATTNVVSGVNGSPNRLLYTR
ncbi:S8 family peptidase [Deinococcus soli (ex Cha et al. 2016)]|uniref:S8 family peptidase n=1 Tax=Deinococcus soli (ex Cha et al. 2016) TaxID=1309411 RepID=UPI0016666D81|nr:S8 family peptidase [Deinococcus soli (ex Cha et al. 2016)]GGB81471.1 serine protease [Deinococcus soli (ex Cha et al. 2016)]